MTRRWPEVTLGCTDESVCFIAEYMRESDRVETQLSSGLKPCDVVRRAVDISGQVWTVSDGDPVAVFGVAGARAGGIPWVLGTDRLGRYARFLVAFPKAFLADAVRRYGYLYNYVWSGNETAKHWLRHLGFRLTGPVRFGVAGADFCYFDMGDIRCANQ